MNPATGFENISAVRRPDTANRVGQFSPSLIRELANASMGREDVLAFWFGESDRPTPAFIRDAAIASLQAGETFYSGEPRTSVFASRHFDIFNPAPPALDR